MIDSSTMRELYVRGRTLFNPVMAVADQVLVSGAHFVVGLSVARSESASALGLFGLGFLLINSSADLHRALIWLPMSQEAATGHFRTARGLSIWLGLALAAVALLAATVLVVAERRVWAALAVGVGVSLPFLFAHEIQRRIQFARLNAAHALATDAVYAATAGMALWLLPAGAGTPVVTAVRALLVLACAAVAATAIGAFLLRNLPPPAQSGRELISRYFPASRAYAANAGLVFGSQRFSMLILAGVLGVDALANVEAARLLSAPLMIAALGLAALAVPAVSHAIRDGGSAAMRALLNKTVLLALLVAGGYALILIFAARPLSELAFNRVYDHSASLGAIFCGIAAVSLVATSLITPLGLAGEAQAVPRARFPGVLLVVLASVPLALAFDERALLGLVLMEGALSAVLLRRAVGRLYREGPIAR